MLCYHELKQGNKALIPIEFSQKAIAKKASLSPTLSCVWKTISSGLVIDCEYRVWQEGVLYIDYSKGQEQDRTG